MHLQNYLSLHFSDEELKEFYLREAVFAHPLLYNHPQGELESLKQLRTNLRNICAFLWKINEHHWDGMAKSLQTATT